MKELFVRKLSKKERDFVYGLINDKKHGYRALIIALSYEGYPVSMIWRKVNKHPVNVRKWIRRFNKLGVAGIAPGKPGRKPKLPKTLEDRIIAIALTKPSELGLYFSTWSLRKLCAYLSKKNVARISHTQLRRILKLRGLSLKKCKLRLISEDPSYEVKKARIQRLLKKPNCIVLFMDEKTVVAKEYAGYEWCFQARIIKRNQRINGKAVLFAALDQHKHKIFWKYLPNLRKESVCKFLKFLVRKFDEDVYLILDNHPSHLSTHVKDIFINNKKLKPEWLPANAPELNQVDRIFSLIQREVLNNRNFPCIEEVKSAIDRWVRKFNSSEIVISLQN